MNKPNFEIFKSGGARLGSNFIGITGNGSISFYSGFMQKEHISEKKYVTLFFDKEQKILGFKPSSEPAGEESLNINISESGKNAWISASNLFKFFGLNPKDFKGRYEPELHEDEKLGKIYMINLGKNLEQPI